MADTQFDVTAALAECQGSILNASAQQRDRLQELERRMANIADGTSGIVNASGGNRELKAAAEKLLKSEALQAVLKGHSPKVGFDVPASAMRLQTKSAIVSDSGSGTYLAPSQNVGAISSSPELVQRLRDLLPISPATSGTIEWLKQTNAKQLAAPQYEASSPALRDGALKAQSNFVMVPTTTPVITLAHWTEASRQVLDDQILLMDFLRAELFDGVERSLENQILNGTGALGEFDGLGNASNYTALTGAQTSDLPVDLIRRAIGQLQAAGYMPDAIVLNAADWADIELSKATTAEYIASDPRAALAPTLWGVRVFPSQYCAAGDFYVGAFAQAMRLWVRQEAMLLVSDSHESNFTRNIITMLSELRACVTVARPGGIIRSTF